MASSTATLALALLVAAAPDVPARTGPTSDAASVRVAEPSPSGHEPSAARDAYDRGKAAFLAADFDECVEHLSQALKEGSREPPADIAAIDIRLALGECKYENARARADANGLREARAIFESIAADAPSLGYTDHDVRDARARGLKTQAALDALAAQAHRDELALRAAERREQEKAARARTRRQTRSAIALLGSGSALAIVGGGLVGYGAWLSPEAERLADDTRPWRAYGATAIGFGTTSLAIGIGAIVWGAVKLRRARGSFTAGSRSAAIWRADLGLVGRLLALQPAAREGVRPITR